MAAGRYGYAPTAAAAGAAAAAARVAAAAACACGITQAASALVAAAAAADAAEAQILGRSAHVAEPASPRLDAAVAELRLQASVGAVVGCWPRTGADAARAVGARSRAAANAGRRIARRDGHGRHGAAPPPDAALSHARDLALVEAVACDPGAPLEAAGAGGYAGDTAGMSPAFVRTGFEGEQVPRVDVQAVGRGAESPMVWGGR